MNDGEEAKLATQRMDIQVALRSITTAVAVLSGQPLSASNVTIPTGRKPMSLEARQRIAEGLRKSAQARAAAKAALAAASAPTASAQEPADAVVEVAAPETPVEVVADAAVAVSEPQEPAEAPADAPVPASPRGSRATRKGARA